MVREQKGVRKGATMQLKIFTIRDTKGEIYHPPFYQRSHGEAERAFTQLINDPKSQISQYPEDYDLYYLGEYDDQTGKIFPETTPKHLHKAVNMKTKPLAN